jgi:hypothetical protein
VLCPIPGAIPQKCTPTRARSTGNGGLHLGSKKKSEKSRMLTFSWASVLRTICLPKDPGNTGSLPLFACSSNNRISVADSLDTSMDPFSRAEGEVIQPSLSTQEFDGFVDVSPYFEMKQVNYIRK